MAQISRRSFLGATVGAGVTAASSVFAQSSETQASTSKIKPLIEELVSNHSVFQKEVGKQGKVFTYLLVLGPSHSSNTNYGIVLPVNYDQTSDKVSPSGDYYIWSNKNLTSPLYFFDFDRDGKVDFVTRSVGMISEGSQPGKGLWVKDMPLEARTEVQNTFDAAVNDLKIAADKQILQYIRK